MLNLAPPFCSKKPPPPLPGKRKIKKFPAGLEPGKKGIARLLTRKFEEKHSEELGEIGGDLPLGKTTVRNWEG